MNYNETRSYIDQKLVKLGWQVRLDKIGYKKIFDFTHGDEERLGQLFYKLVGMGSQQPKREITDRTVTAAINDLRRMNDIVDQAKAQAKVQAQAKVGVEDKAAPKSRVELDRISIEQLAKALESEVALSEKEARVAEEQFPTVETIPDKPAPTDSLPRILVVDDSPTVRAAVTKALKNDFSFVQAPDGEKAWTMLKGDDSIQLVITDLMMPRLDGYELIKRIRSDRNSPRLLEIPIIVVTTLEDTNAKLRALVAGANDFVTKSTDAMELKMRVMARYKVAQRSRVLEREKAAVQSANAATPTRAPQVPTTSAHPRTAPQAPATSVPPRNAQATSVPPRNVYGAGISPAGNGSSAAAVRSAEVRTVSPEAPRPIRPAAVSSAVSPQGEAILPRDVSSFGPVSDVWKRMRDWFEKVNPLTATTIGATALIVLLVIGIIIVNRSHKAASLTTAAIPAGDTTVASSEGVIRSSPPVEDPSFALPAAVDPYQTRAGKNDAATGDIPKAASTSKTREQAPATKRDRQSADTGATAASSRTHAAKQAPATSTVAKTGTVPAARPELETSTPAATNGAQAVEPTPGDGSVNVAAGEAAGATANAAVAAAAAVPAPSVAAAVPAPSNVITQAELATLVKRFEFVYEAGDIEQFLRLFDDDVRTNDRFSKAGLREDYEDLFRTTEMRVMTFKNVTWDPHNNRADGWGNFEVKVRKTGQQEVKEYKGSLTFYVEKINGRLLIKRLYHGQWRAG
jgi:CheY-like chemotaxis protein